MAAANPAAERTSTTARDGGDDSHIRKRKPRTASAELDRLARPVRRRSDEVRGLVVQTETVPRSREASPTPRLNATLDSEGSALGTQMYCTLVMTTAGAALGKCHNAGVNEGFEAWRQFVMEWEPKLRTRFVGLLMNVLGYRFRDDIPNKLAAFERTIHDYENSIRQRPQTTTSR